jgi:hypothetical protein
MNNKTIESSELFDVKLDSNADTCCVGRDVVIVNDTMRTVTGTSFLTSLGTMYRTQ